MIILLEITSKIPGFKGRYQLEVAAGTSVQDVLHRLAITGDKAEILAVYNGKAVYHDDTLPESGELVLFPMLCGG